MTTATEVRPCPTCRQPREVRVRRAATAVRVCPSCGDRRTVLAKNLRKPNRLCFDCANKANRRKPEPRDDIDEVMVDRIMGGRDSGANLAERLEAAARLLGLYGLPVSLVAERLGVPVRTVYRYRKELRDTGRLAA